MPLGAPFKFVGVWDGIEERFRKKLATWKRQYISKRGEDYLNSMYLVQFIDLFYVSFPIAKGGQDETGTNSKGLSVGWWGY